MLGSSEVGSKRGGTHTSAVVLQELRWMGGKVQVKWNLARISKQTLAFEMTWNRNTWI